MPNACHKTKRCQHATIVSNVRWHFLERKTMFNFRPRIPSTLHLRLVNSRMQPVCRNSDYFDSLQEFCLHSSNQKFIGQVFRSSHIFVYWFLPFWYFGHFSSTSFFPFFPSCLAKCKQIFHNIFVFFNPKRCGLFGILDMILRKRSLIPPNFILEQQTVSHNESWGL